MMRLKKWGVNALVVLIAFAFGGWAYTERQGRRVANCQQMNELRIVLRMEAKESYDNRFRNLRILNVQPTKDVLGVIDTDFHRKMSRLRLRKC